tara:strand:- start:4 stop:651 length:648 start_codon:yes stop_codon:yes gene_type:complete
MKKILLITVAVLFSFAQVNADNMSEGFRLGISVSNTEVNGSGSETLRTTKRQSAVASTSETTTIGHVFAERTFSNGFTLGVDYVPGEADVGTKTRADDDFDTSGGNKASAVVSQHLTFYGLMPMGSSPFYVKAGVISMDVETKEKLNTGSKYGNTSVNGVTAGIGAHFERDNGVYFRTEYSMSEYEDIRLTSTGSNIVEADIDTTAMKISIGKSF